VKKEKGSKTLTQTYKYQNIYKTLVISNTKILNIIYKFLNVFSGIAQVLIETVFRILCQ
jgi:hypothetical protein